MGLEIRRGHSTQTRDDCAADRRRRRSSPFTWETAPPTLAPSQIAQILKGESSKWIHREFHQLKGFSWQDACGSLASAPRIFLRLFLTSKISANIIGVRHFKKNIWSFYRRVVSNTMSDIYGDDSCVADATAQYSNGTHPALKGWAKLRPSLRD